MNDMTNFDRSTAIVWIAITAVHDAERKARKHSVQKLKKLARSISETGYFNPILLDEKNVVIAGHARLEAAKRLGMLDVPALYLRGLSESQKKALRLADNRLPEEAKWDTDLLALELGELIVDGMEIELTGFDAIEIDRLLTPKQIVIDKEEELPPSPETPVSRLGDCWQCGVHLIGCGDARDDAIYRLLLGDASADMVFADPPYNVAIPGNVSGLGQTTHENFVMASGEMSEAEFSEFLTKVMVQLKAHSCDGSVHFQCIDWRHVSDMVAAGRAQFDAMLNICVWCKPNGGMGSLYRSQHEMVVVFKNGTAPHVNNVQLGRMGRYRSNLWHYSGGTSFSATRSDDLAAHPTVKPTDMVADAIRDVTSPGDIVLDPFGGSGTTMLAAEKTGRKAVLIELDPKYVDVALERFQRFTGIEPVLIATGETITAVRATREGGNRD